jgi:hypothetical protein
MSKKNRIRKGHPLVAREYGFKFIPQNEFRGSVTFTLPYAGAIRIRFKGLPVTQALSLTLADTPSNARRLNKAMGASQIAGSNRSRRSKSSNRWSRKLCGAATKMNPSAA